MGHIYPIHLSRHNNRHNKRYLMSIFENYGIFALSKWELNKLSNDTRFIQIELILLKIREKDVRCKIAAFVVKCHIFSIR